MSTLGKRGEHSTRYWQAKRESAATPAAEASVAWDEMRSALATLGRVSSRRVANARTDRERRDAAARQERAARLAEDTWPRVIGFLSGLTGEIRRLS